MTTSTTQRNIKKTRMSIWDDRRTRAIQDLGYLGVTHATIARCVGLSQSAIAYRLGRLGIATGGERRCESQRSAARALKVLDRHSIDAPRVLTKWLPAAAR